VAGVGVKQGMAKRAIVTGGATREPLDDVRFMTNLATGALAAEISEALLAQGWEVHHVHGPGAKLPGKMQLDLDLLAPGPRGVGAQLDRVQAVYVARNRLLSKGKLHIHPVTTAADTARVLARLCKRVQPRLAVCAMAVADYAPVPHSGKLSSDSSGLDVRLLPTPKAIDGVKRACPTCKLLAFKLLSGASESELIDAAMRVTRRSGADLIFANDLNDYYGGQRRGLLVGPDGAIAARLDGGVGEGAVRRLALAIVAALGARLAPDPLDE
jgi:phosphopantothenoylcysteine decarboxylase/phosphopantothenate--cysteine ligase